MTLSPAVLLTTCHVEQDGIEDLRRLVASIDAARRSEEVVSVRHIVLLQGCSATQRQDIASQYPEWVEFLSDDGRLSSPAARNVMIRHLVDGDAFDPAAFVGFPDDDAWYPPGTLACLTRRFGDDRDLKLVVSRYGPDPSASECSGAFRATLQQMLSRGACAAIFARAELLARLGGFNPLLGLGTVLRGGEDTDFVHRAYHLSNGAVEAVPGFLVGHAAADPSKKATYYEGGLAAIMAQGHASSEARVALARKLAVGVSLVLRGRLSWTEFTRALRLARTHRDAIRKGPLA